jgi:hypothetical protein
MRSLLGLAFATPLLLAFGIFGDGRDTLVADGPMTDAEVVEHRGFEQVDQIAVLRVSHPTRLIFCEIRRDRFADDWPPVGTILPVESAGSSCDLPTVHRGVPRTQLTIWGTVCLALLLWGCWRSWRGHRRRHESDDQDRERSIAHMDRVRAEARRRRRTRPTARQPAVGRQEP